MPDVKYSLFRGNTSGIDATPLRDGQILFDQEAKKIAIDTVVNSNLTRVNMSGDSVFSGTTAEWNALTDTQKEKYQYVYITDDYEPTSSVMTGATASSDGTKGLVPQPLAGDQNKVLYGDGTWKEASFSGDWKEAVDTYNDIATTYPNPVDGWTVNVKDTDYTYRYNGSTWVAISANAIPQATTSVNGLMTTTQVTKLNGIATGAEVNVQSDWSVTDSSSDAFIKNKPTIPDVSTKMDKSNPTGTGTFSLNRLENSTVGSYSFAEGYNVTASGNYGAHAEGQGSTASGNTSHAEGFESIASQSTSHAEGYQTTASGKYSHSEGYKTEASNDGAHAEGWMTEASGAASHAEGSNTKAQYAYQHVSGKFNDNKTDTLFEIGKGTANNARSNAFEVYSDGSLSTDNGTTKVKLENLVSQSEPIENTVDFTDVISISDAFPKAAKDVKLKVDAVQALHGYDNPWVGGAGKNKAILDIDAIKANNTSGTWNGNVYTANGGTITFLTDSANNITEIKVNGTFNPEVQMVFDAKTIALTQDEFIFSCAKNSDDAVGVNNGYVMFISNVNGASAWISSNEDATTRRTFTITNTAERVRLGLYIWSGVTINNASFFPMIRKTSEPTGFEPYTNICPISGWDNAKVTREGKNLLENTAITETKSGITFAVDSNGVVSLSGVLTAQYVVQMIHTDWVAPKSGDYIFGGCPSGATIDTYYMNIWNSRIDTKVYEQPITFTATKGEKFNLAIVVRNLNGATRVIKPMITSADVPNSDYDHFEPYKGAETTISLNGTRYGCTLGVTSGVLTVDRVYGSGTVTGINDSYANITYGTFDKAADSAAKGNYNKFDIISSMFYSPTAEPSNWNDAANVGGIFMTASTNLYWVGFPKGTTQAEMEAATADHKIVYKLATPQTIQLTAEEVQLLLGYNTLFADTGDIQLTYNPATYGNIIEEVGELEDLVKGGDKLSAAKPVISTRKTWFTKTWTGLTNFTGSNVWTDGDNIYYSSGSSHYILEKSTSTWSTKTWTGLTNFTGSNVWTDGDNIYYSSGSSHYILDKTTSTWSTKTWNGYTSITGPGIWTDGDNIYYSDDSGSYVLDKSTSTWSTKTWSGELTVFMFNAVWTDGDDIYYSSGSNQYVLDKTTSTWSTKTWNGLTKPAGSDIWTDGDNIYYSGLNQYVLDKSTSTWSTKTWGGITRVYGSNVWTDGDNIYCSNNSIQYVLGDKIKSTKPTFK